MSNLETDSQIEPVENVESEAKTETRRQFLKESLFFGGAALVATSPLLRAFSRVKPGRDGHVSRPKGATDVMENANVKIPTPDIQPYLKDIETLTEHASEIHDSLNPYLQTMIDSGGFWVLNAAISITCSKLGIKIGNAGFEDPEVFKKVLNNPLFGETMIGVLAPFGEEAVFRLLPSIAVNSLLHDKKGTVWVVGVPVAALFAGAHNFTDGKFDTKTIPLSQFLLGLFAWYKMRHGGYLNSVLAHSTFNNTSLILLYSLANLVGSFEIAGEKLKKGNNGWEIESKKKEPVTIRVGRLTLSNGLDTDEDMRRRMRELAELIESQRKYYKDSK